MADLLATSSSTTAMTQPLRATCADFFNSLLALRHALGGTRFEFLMGLLAFIRTAHYWTVIHPDLVSEKDVSELLATNEELARLLLQDPEAARCDMGMRVFSE